MGGLGGVACAGGLEVAGKTGAYTGDAGGRGRGGVACAGGLEVAGKAGANTGGPTKSSDATNARSRKGLRRLVNPW